MNGPQIGWLPDGRRLHMNHGPIDLIVEAWGEASEVEAAYAQAAARFGTILAELVSELAELRKAASPAAAFASGTVCDDAGASDPFKGRTARRMHAAASRFAGFAFVTPMAAVAGAVADEMLAAMVAGRRLDRAYVNDGGDIAIHLAAGAEMRLAIGGKGNGFADRLLIRFTDAARGIATSGWRGRSHSLGIADAVTVVARDGASADVAATLIANAVDLPGHPAIRRRPARELSPDSDLGDRLVTVDVGALPAPERAAALGSGTAFAKVLRGDGLIEGAALFLGGSSAVVGEIASRTQGIADAAA